MPATFLLTHTHKHKLMLVHTFISRLFVCQLIRCFICSLLTNLSTYVGMNNVHVYVYMLLSMYIVSFIRKQLEWRTDEWVLSTRPLKRALFSAPHL